MGCFMPVQFFVRHKPFEVFDGNGFVQVGPPTVFLTGTDTDPPHNSRQRKAVTNHIQGFFKAALFDTLDILGDIEMNGAGFRAGRRNV